MATSDTVMVLDDDADIRELLDELLSEEGYQVCACATTAEADARLAKAKAQRRFLAVVALVDRLSTPAQRARFDQDEGDL